MPNRKHWWPGFTLYPTSSPPCLKWNAPDQLLLSTCRLYASFSLTYSCAIYIRKNKVFLQKGQHLSHFKVNVVSALCSLYFSIITANNVWVITLSVCRVKSKRKRPIISIIWTAHRGSFRGLIVFCLNKSVNEQQSLDAGSSLRISADLGGPSRSWPNTRQGKNKSVCQCGVRSLN